MHGPANVLGIDGNIVLNIDSKTQNLLGVFHFPTISLAGGNIIFFENSLAKSNNIIIKVNNRLNKPE